MHRAARCCAVVVLAVATTAGAEAAQNASGSDTAGAVAAARALIEGGSPSAAIARLEGLEDRDRPDVQLALGVAYYHADDHAQAVAHIAPVAGSFADGTIERREADQVLGLSYFLLGRFAEAVPLLEKTRTWAAGNAELGYVLGQAYVQTHQPAKARASFAALYGLPAESAAAHLLTAQMMIRLEFETFAEDELKQAIRIDPKLPQAHQLLGQLLLFRGLVDEAIAETEREIAISPANAMAFYQLGDALLQQEQWDQGIDALQKSIWINPYYSAPYIVLGKAYLHKAQLATAEGMLRRAIAYDPNNRSAHYLLGQVLQRMGRADEAKQEFAAAERLRSQPGR